MLCAARAQHTLVERQLQLRVAGGKLEARALGQHLFEGRNASLHIELLRDAGHGNDLGLGFALGLQAVDHALGGKAAQLGVIGADV